MCWGFDDEAGFHAAAVSFLSTGLELGQPVQYPEDDVHTALTGARPGAVEVISVLTQYATSTPADPRAQVEAYAAATAFIDHERLAALIEHARRLDATLVLRTDQPLPRRLLSLLDDEGVRVEAAP